MPILILVHPYLLLVIILISPLSLLTGRNCLFAYSNNDSSSALNKDQVIVLRVRVEGYPCLPSFEDQPGCYRDQSV